MDWLINRTLVRSMRMHTDVIELDLKNILLCSDTTYFDTGRTVGPPQNRPLLLQFTLLELKSNK